MNNRNNGNAMRCDKKKAHSCTTTASSADTKSTWNTQNRKNLKE